MANSVYRVGLSQGEVDETTLQKAGFSWERVRPRETIVSVAHTLIGVPYKFGASVSKDSPHAFDCSSLTAHLYARAGYAIPRVCDAQYRFGKQISEAEALPGDLVFFKGNRDDIPKDVVGHNGVYVGDGTMIHAGGVQMGYGKVVKEKITESKYYPTGFLGYVRFLPTEEDRYVVEVPLERKDLQNKDTLLKALRAIK